MPPRNRPPGNSHLLPPHLMTTQQDILVPKILPYLRKVGNPGKVRSFLTTQIVVTRQIHPVSGNETE